MFGGFKKYRAVINAMNAKLTWEELDDRFRLGVQSAAENLWMSGGRSSEVVEDDNRRARVEDSIQRMGEFQKWSLYAMAMEQIGIPPSLDGENWDNSRNPFTLRVNAKDALVAADHFSRIHRVNVTIELE